MEARLLGLGVILEQAPNEWNLRSGNVFLRCSSVAESYQDEIVEEGGLKALFELIKKSLDETTHRLAAGAVANLAVSGERRLLGVFSTGRLVAARHTERCQHRCS